MLIYICDDDPRFADSLSQKVRSFFSGQCEIEVFRTADSMTAALTRKPDIILLDIELEKDNGIAVAIKNRLGSNGHTQVIFVTGYFEYCTDVYETDHIYFLLKPLKEHELKRALEKAVRNLSRSSIRLIVRNTEESFSLPLADILYIESHLRRLSIHTVSGASFQMSGRLSTLPENIRSELIQCHKSYLVNPAHAVSITHPSGSSNRFFLLDNGESISISQSMWRSCSSQFLNLLNSNPKEEG